MPFLYVIFQSSFLGGLVIAKGTLIPPAHVYGLDVSYHGALDICHVAAEFAGPSHPSVDNIDMSGESSRTVSNKAALLTRQLGMFSLLLRSLFVPFLFIKIYFDIWFKELQVGNVIIFIFVIETDLNSRLQQATDVVSEIQTALVQ